MSGGKIDRRTLAHPKCAHPKCASDLKPIESEKKKQIGQPDGKKRLHLGCAAKRLEGWTNIDIDASHHPDLVHDVLDLKPFTTGSVDEIYSSHTLEHSGRARIVGVLCEWNRVLKIGG